MGIIAFMNKRAQKLSIWDIKLVQGSAMCVILIIAKLIPQIMEMDIWWFVIVLILISIKPVVTFYFKS
jgi:hypothetical protein